MHCTSVMVTHMIINNLQAKTDNITFTVLFPTDKVPQGLKITLENSAININQFVFNGHVFFLFLPSEALSYSQYNKKSDGIFKKYIYLYCSMPTNILCSNTTNIQVLDNFISTYFSNNDTVNERYCVCICWSECCFYESKMLLQ